MAKWSKNMVTSATCCLCGDNFVMGDKHQCAKQAERSERAVEEDNFWLSNDNWHSVNVKDGYYPLFAVLRDALEQAQDGKGSERHANGLPFDEQPVLTITRAVGLGFPLGQAMKKIEESQRMDTDAAQRELLGAINYLAAAVLYLNE